MILVPLLFSLGVPLVNIERPLAQKIGLTIVSAAFSMVIFLVTITVALNIEYDKYLLPGLLAGAAGVAILTMNGLLIASIKLNFRTIGMTFLLSGLSLPAWIALMENVFPSDISRNALVRQLGVTLSWMISTTIGICLSIPKGKDK